MCNEYELDDDGNMIAFYRISRLSHERKVGQAAVSLRITDANPVIRLNGNGDRVADVFRWGLIPFWWSKDARGPPLTWNAVSEKLHSAPMFRDAFRQGQRCLVPATGFFEHPINEQGLQVRTKIKPRSQHYMAFAGLWDRWRPPQAEEPLFSYTILTTAPNGLMGPIHHRMPCVLSVDDYDDWLAPETSPDSLKALLMPCPSEWLEAVPVGEPKPPSADKLRRWRETMGG